MSHVVDVVASGGAGAVGAVTGPATQRIGFIKIEDSVLSYHQSYHSNHQSYSTTPYHTIQYHMLCVVSLQAPAWPPLTLQALQHC